jgi:hypothetical protein
MISRERRGESWFARVHHVRTTFGDCGIATCTSVKRRPLGLTLELRSPVHLFPGSKRFPRSSRKAGSTHSHQPTLRHDRRRQKQFSRRVRQTCTVVVSVDPPEPRLDAAIDEVPLASSDESETSVLHGRTTTYAFNLERHRSLSIGICRSVNF